MSRLKSILELEQLVASGGDEARVYELRLELGIIEKTKQTAIKGTGNTTLRKRFDVGWYKTLKRRGVPDYLIAEELGVSRQYFNRFKKSIGLTCKGKGSI